MISIRFRCRLISARDPSTPGKEESGASRSDDWTGGTKPVSIFLLLILIARRESRIRASRSSKDRRPPYNRTDPISMRPLRPLRNGAGPSWSGNRRSSNSARGIPFVRGALYPRDRPRAELSSSSPEDRRVRRIDSVNLVIVPQHSRVQRSCDLDQFSDDHVIGALRSHLTRITPP